MGGWWHEEGSRVSRGTRKAASSTRGCSQASDNTKAARLVHVYEHGTHSMGHCPNLINEMMMLTGVFSFLHPVTDPRRAKYPQTINSQCPCQIIVYEKTNACGNLGWRGLMYVLLRTEIISLAINGLWVCQMTNQDTLAFLGHFLSRLVSDDYQRSPMSKYQALPRHNYLASADTLQTKLLS